MKESQRLETTAELYRLYTCDYFAGCDLTEVGVWALCYLGP